MTRNFSFTLFSLCLITSLLWQFPQQALALSLFWLTILSYLRGRQSYIPFFYLLSWLLYHGVQAHQIAVIFLGFTWHEFNRWRLFLHHQNTLKLLSFLSVPPIILFCLFLSPPESFFCLYAYLSAQFLGSFLIKHLPEGLVTCPYTYTFECIFYIIAALMGPLTILALQVSGHVVLFRYRHDLKIVIGLALRQFIVIALILHTTIDAPYFFVCLNIISIPSYIIFLKGPLCTPISPMVSLKMAN